VDAHWSARWLAFASTCALLLAATPARAAVQLVPIATATTPVYITHAGDDRIFIVELRGLIKVYDRGSGMLLPTPFLDLSAKLAPPTTGDRGLFSMAFHPDYAQNGYFYVNYIRFSGGGPAVETVIERYQVSANPDQANPSSGVPLLTVPQPTQHFGGQLQVSPVDGHLYTAFGDASPVPGGDPACNSQTLGLPYGKMLRLDIRQNLNQPPYYGIPADNPFTGAGDPGGLIPDEVWAVGFRNPWRFSFDRANGDLYIADVGQEAREEVSLHRVSSPGGQNYGWKVMEGSLCFSSSGCPAGTPACNSPALTLPIHDYVHVGAGCSGSVTGGYVSRGSNPDLAGRYVFGDFCKGWIRALTEVSPGSFQVTAVLQASFGLVTFGEDSDGNLYVAVANQVSALVSDTPVPTLQLYLLLALAAALGALGFRFAAR
jgi:glucose/arabinose dehydrogenase